MKSYGLVGYPLSHSFSEEFFRKKFLAEGIDAEYKCYPQFNLEELKSFLKKTKLDAFNVTIPYKEKIITLLDELHPDAKRIAAVNCVVRSNGKWKGYNTDHIGFETSLENFCSLKNKKALILGNGGAAKAVQFVLEKNKVAFLIVTRQSLQNTITYDELTQANLKEHLLLINTTPVGMFPFVKEVLPLPFHWITKQHYVFDMIYNPAKTELLRISELHGAKICNGLRMLEIQAEESYKLFFRNI